MKIYLSGGMRSGWQDRMPRIDGVTYSDPRFDSPQNISARVFTKKDVKLTKESDLVFLYMEKDNPSGYGAIWECAIATENKIPIIAVWEKELIDPFVACNSLYLFNDFNAAIKKLESYINTYKKEVIV